MCAIRREYSGDVSLLAGSCWPVFTSQRRNSAFKRRSAWRSSGGHQGLRFDGLPVLNCGALYDVVDLFNEGRRIDRREPVATLEVVVMTWPR